MDLVPQAGRVLEAEVARGLVHLLLEGADEAGQLVSGQFGEVGDVVAPAGALVATAATMVVNMTNLASEYPFMRLLLRQKRTAKPNGE